MDFSLSGEQRLLQDSVRRFVQAEYDFPRRRAIMGSEHGFSREHWRRFAELGWLAIPFEEAHGGIGGSLHDVVIVLEEFGKGLVLEPFLATVMLGGMTVAALGSDQQCSRYIPAVIQGELLLALADAERQTRGDVRQTCTTASLVRDGFVLNGRKALVLNGDSADLLLVVARTAGKPGDAEGLGVFLVAPDTPGVTVLGYPTVDGGRAADIVLDDVRVDATAVLGQAGHAHGGLVTVLDRATIALCAEAVGCMETTWRNTVEYCRTRKQFGVPIGSFQVLQHRMADMFMAHEQTRSLLMMATLQGQETGPALMRAASAVKALVGKWGRRVGQEAIQLHGGMGMSDEMPIGYFFKRLTAIDALFGNTDQHIDRYAGSA